MGKQGPVEAVDAVTPEGIAMHVLSGLCPVLRANGKNELNGTMFASVVTMESTA
jgi:hypothetical protein